MVQLLPNKGSSEIDILVSTKRDEIVKFFCDNADTEVDLVLNHNMEGGIFRKPQSVDIGIDCPTIDFFMEVHEICTQTHVCPSRIVIHWGNVNSHSLYNQWCDIHKPEVKFKEVGYRYMCFTLAESCATYHEFYLSNKHVHRPKLFTCLNAANRPHRARTINYLYSNDMLNDSIWSWLDRPVAMYDTNDSLHNDLHSMVPKYIDNVTSIVDASANNPRGTQFWETYNSTYFDIISETLYHHDQAYYADYDWWVGTTISEKVGRSLLNMRPFVVVGNKHILKYLKLLGFKTFPHIFDEAYDDLPDELRLDYLMDSLKTLTYEFVHDATNSDETVKILEHNKQLMEQYISVRDTDEHITLKL
jgi:hypothetical protein